MHEKEHDSINAFCDFIQSQFLSFSFLNNSSVIFPTFFSTSIPILAVAYSGGLDSSVLLNLMTKIALQKNIKLYAFHIHHGISNNANNWMQHCQQVCLDCNIEFIARKIILSNYINTANLEERARIARYKALGVLCNNLNVNLLLTAHHLDDQAETVLLRLFRGCGVIGISAIDEIMYQSSSLLGASHAILIRPLLKVPRSILKQYAQVKSVKYIEDASNTNVQHTRNILRHCVVPMLVKYFPGFQARLARTAQHAQSAKCLLIKLAQQDLMVCKIHESLSVVKLKQLSVERCNNLLRYWFSIQSIRMPSSSKLHEIRKQLLTSKQNAQIYLKHENYVIQCYRNLVYLTKYVKQCNLTVPKFSFVWHNESIITFPQFFGSLIVQPAKSGLNVTWLRQQLLFVQLRSGGEKLKLSKNKPTKSLKQHYNAMHIPPWKRYELPLIFAHDKLLYAVGIGMNYHLQLLSNQKNSADSQVTLSWKIS